MGERVGGGCGREVMGRGGRDDQAVPCFFLMKNPAFSEIEAALARASALLLYSLTTCWNSGLVLSLVRGDERD